MNYRKIFFLFILIGIALSSTAQKTRADKEVAYHNAVIRATFKKIEKYHYHPRAMDTVYSQRVWGDFIRLLDPQKNIFLQEDIQQLSSFKNKLGEALSNGSSVFFDSVYSRYHRRIREASVMCKQLLASPLNLEKNESVVVLGSKQAYPASASARKNIWRKMIKYAVLNHYMRLDSASATKENQVAKIDTAIERKSVNYVRRWYANYFRNALRDAAMDSKFALYVSAAVGEIDPHTAYIAPTDRTMKEAITKQFFGIGIELGVKDLDFYVKRIMRGGSAYTSGKVKENDQIRAIANNKGDMQQVSGMVATQVANMIRGEKGTSVTLQLEQPGQTARTVTLKRGEVLEAQNRAKSAIIEKDGKKFGYIYLPLFYMDPKGLNRTGASNDVAREVMKLQENEVDGIVMDLRDNGGGSLDEVVKMCGSFLPGGAITWLKGKKQINRYGVPENGRMYYDGPLTVLVNESTASASEIFSAAMQDYNRAIILGTSTTFGKGTAQSTMNMGKMGNPAKGTADTSYGSLRLTEQKFYRITGISTQLAGVKPDIVLQNRMSLGAQMEKNYLSALPADTLQLPAFEPLTPTYNYQKVVKGEKQRLLHNPNFALITKKMQALKKLNEAPVALNFAAFKKNFEIKKSLEKDLKQAYELDANQRLEVQPSKFRSIRPGTLKKEPEDVKIYQDWLQKLSKDIYLNETINVLNDMLTNAQK